MGHRRRRWCKTLTKIETSFNTTPIDGLVILTVISSRFSVLQESFYILARPPRTASIAPRSVRCSSELPWTDDQLSHNHRKRCVATHQAIVAISRKVVAIMI